MKNEPVFRIVFNTKDFLLIEDVGPWDQFQTITNGAQEVLLHLAGLGHLQTHQRLFYIDSDGEMDEIIFSIGSKFQEFKPIGGVDEVGFRCHSAWKWVELSRKHSRAYQEFRDQHPELNWQEAEEVMPEDLAASADFFDRLLADVKKEMKKSSDK